MTAMLWSTGKDAQADMRRERDQMRRGLRTTFQKKTKVLEPRVFQTTTGARGHRGLGEINKVFVGICKELKVRTERYDRK